MDRYGQLEQADERWQLRFVRRLPHSPEKVWRAITEEEQVSKWFPCDIVGERAAGAALQFVFRENEGPTIEGRMTAFEPPRLLEMTWGDDVLRFELTPDGDGTLLTFLDTVDELGKAARDAAGWHVCLDVLDIVANGEEPPFDAQDRWREVEAHYVETFPPEASTIGPPEEYLEAERRRREGAASDAAG